MLRILEYFSLPFICSAQNVDKHTHTHTHLLHTSCVQMNNFLTAFSFLCVFVDSRVSTDLAAALMNVGVPIFFLSLLRNCVLEKRIRIIVIDGNGQKIKDELKNK